MASFRCFWFAAAPGSQSVFARYIDRIADASAAERCLRSRRHAESNMAGTFPYRYDVRFIYGILDVRLCRSEERLSTLALSSTGKVP